MKPIYRKPSQYADPIPERHQKKWDRIIQSFMQGDIDELKKIQRGGTRGRIFAALVKKMFEILQMQGEPEPVFDHVTPNAWYIEFAKVHDLKLRIHDYYNPDYLLPDGTWIEVTLSENTAYKKIFRYGHQAPALKVLRLDEDEGLHKQVCKDIVFPNASVQNIETYFLDLEHLSDGDELIGKFNQLKAMKGTIK